MAQLTGREMNRETAGKRNIRLVVEYDGSAYHGFQIQVGQNTAQSELESALSVILKERVKVYGAGRTDAGVHATGQVVNFHTDSSIDLQRLRRALNGVLPDDISVLHAKTEDPSFHARYSARSREYTYRISDRAARPAVHRFWIHHVRARLDAELMRTACATLVGQRDFAAFGCGLRPDENTIRTVMRAECRREGDLVEVVLEADGFLPQMVRSIVGTLIQVGIGKTSLTQFANIVDSCDRKAAGSTAPARGLCLTRVTY